VVGLSEEDCFSRFVLGWETDEEEFIRFLLELADDFRRSSRASRRCRRRAFSSINFLTKASLV